LVSTTTTGKLGERQMGRAGGDLPVDGPSGGVFLNGVRVA